MLDYLKSKTVILWVWIILTIALLAWYIWWDKMTKSVVDVSTLYATILATLGIWIGYIQIQSLKTENQEVKNAVLATLNRVNQILSVAELTKSISITQEIQNFIRDSRHDLAVLRMRDLKSYLVQTRNYVNLLTVDENELLDKCIFAVAVDLTDILERTSSPKSLNVKAINKNLAMVETMLEEFVRKFKNVNYGS